MADTSKTVFISYRRNVSSFIARAIFMDLREHGYDVFMDVESIDSGAFDTIILNQIAARAHFLLILTPGTLERCDEPGDWLRREIEHAMDLGRNIVPLLINDFKFDEQAKKHLTEKLAELPRFNALSVPHDYFDAAMDKLRTRFLKEPVYGVIQPTPVEDQAIVQQKIEEVISQSQPTEEQYVDLGNECRENGDYDGAIKNYTEAIQLNPALAEAYCNRGDARRAKGDPDGAIVDLTEAIRLNPEFAEAYKNRALILRFSKHDNAGAIADFSEAIRINPQDSNAYFDRGWVRQDQNDNDGAIADYSEAIRLDPQNAKAYVYRAGIRLNNDNDGAIADYTEAIRADPQCRDAYHMRGLLLDHKGDFDGALADYTELIHLNPQSASAYRDRGRLLERKGDLEKALADYEAALLIYPNYYEARTDRDDLLKKMKKKK